MKHVAKAMNKSNFQEKSCCVIEGIPLNIEAVEGRITTIATADAE
jgi:hypothetical protein